MTAGIVLEGGEYRDFLYTPEVDFLSGTYVEFLDSMWRIVLHFCKSDSPLLENQALIIPA